MSTFLLFAFSFLFSALAFAQPDTLWTYGCRDDTDDYPVDVVVTRDGGAAMLIQWQENEYSLSTALLIKLDSFGEEEWRRYYPTLFNPEALIECHDGGFAFVGEAELPPGGAQVVRADCRGDTLWAKTVFSGSWTSSSDLVQTSDEGFAVLLQESILIRLTANGDSVWARTFDIESLWMDKLALMPDGGFLFCGSDPSHRDPDRNLQAWAVRTDAEGQHLWEQEMGNEQHEHVSGLAVTGDGGCIVAGARDPDGSDRVYYPFAASVSGHGDTLWTRVYSDSIGYLSDIAKLTDGRFLCFGAYRVAGVVHHLLLCINETGDVQWRIDRPSTSLAVAKAMRLTPDGGCICLVCDWGLNGTRWDAVAVRLSSVMSSADRRISSQTSTELVCFPNPCNGWPRITLSPDWFARGSVLVEVFDVLGRKVHEQVVRENATIIGGADMESHVPTGLYFIRAKAGEVQRIAKVMLIK